MQGDNILKKYWKYIVAILIGIFIGFMFNHPYKESDPIIQYVEVHDTVSIPIERIVENTKIQYVKDTTIVVDSVEVKGDTIYATIPQEYKVYTDVIKTDSTSTEIKIEHHGVESQIDNVYLKHSYYNTNTIVPQKQKNIHPFLFIQGGPKTDLSFREVNGFALEAGGGLFFKSGYGVIADYELGVGQNIDHTFKVGLIKQF